MIALPKNPNLFSRRKTWKYCSWITSFSHHFHCLVKKMKRSRSDHDDDPLDRKDQRVMDDSISLRPSETLSNDSAIVAEWKSNLVTIQHDMATLEQEVTSMEAQVASREKERLALWESFFEITQEMSPIQKSMERVEEDVAAAKACWNVLDDPPALRFHILQRIGQLGDVIQPGDSPEAIRKKIDSHVSYQESLLKSKQRKLQEKEDLRKEIEDLLHDRKQLIKENATSSSKRRRLSKRNKNSFGKEMQSY